MLKFTTTQSGTAFFRDKTVVYDKDRYKNVKVYFLGMKVFERDYTYNMVFNDSLDNTLGFK